MEPSSDHLPHEQHPLFGFIAELPGVPPSRFRARISANASGIANILFVGRYVTASIDADFEVGDGVIGRTVPGSLMRLDIAEADAWAAPVDRIRRAIARQIGVRYVYVLHVTEQTIVEFVGLAGAESLKTADALPMLLQFAFDIVDSSSPIRDADVAGGPSVRELRSRSPSPIHRANVAELSSLERRSSSPFVEPRNASPFGERQSALPLRRNSPFRTAAASPLQRVDLVQLSSMERRIASPVQRAASPVQNVDTGHVVELGKLERQTAERYRQLAVLRKKLQASENAARAEQADAAARVQRTAALKARIAEGAELVSSCRACLESDTDQLFRCGPVKI